MLAERYQYGRTARPSLPLGFSMAKTVVGDARRHRSPREKTRLDRSTADREVRSRAQRPRRTATPGPRPPHHVLGHPLPRELRRRGRQREAGRQHPAAARRSGGVDTVLEFKQREAPAGTRFRYASADTQVLGLVLIAAVNAAARRLPLGEDLAADGRRGRRHLAPRRGRLRGLGYCCLNATLRDYARLGMLLANDGALDGKTDHPRRVGEGQPQPPRRRT